MTDRNMLMREIQEYSFAVIESVLYLDTNPCDEKALEYHRKYSELYRQAVAKYEQSFGPITMYSGSECEKWQWTAAPWPWEYTSSDCERK